VRSAASIDSSIAFWRRSSASAMRGNASLPSRNIETPKTTSVQIISPMSGETRKLPLSSSAWARTTALAMPADMAAYRKNAMRPATSP
jgi:hypothetical protein